MSTTTLPLLLPASALGVKSESDPQEWMPSKYMQAPQPPPTDDSKQHDLEMAAARQLIDGKAFKKVRPRRTVDYFAGVGRWTLLRKTSSNPRCLPYMRPAAPYIIDLLPPKAYPENPSTSLCTKFVHTSTNKIRCPVNCVVWTPECRRVLTGSTSGEFTLWNGLTFNFETILQAHETAIRAMRFTHSGAFLASADQSGVIKYFQPNMNNLTAWNGHREAIRALSFSPDDRRFATASDDSTVRIWAFEEQREERVLTGHGWDVKCVEWHPTKGLLVSGSKDNMMKFWDPRTGNCISTLHFHKNTIQALAWSPNGNMVASASRDQTVRVFDIRAMREVQTLRGHKKEVCSVTWHPFHPVLVSGGSEGSILHWDLSSSPVPPSSIIQSSSYDPSTAFEPTNSPPPRATLSQAHDSNVWALAFHSLGHLLASASNDHTTRFWCRERPGDAASVFSGGGEKPPEADPNAGDQEDYEDLMVPGFTDGPGESWWEDQMDGGTGGGGSGGGLPGMGSSGGRFSQMDSYGSGRDFGGQGGSGGNDDFIPGFGGVGESSGGGGYSGGGGGGGRDGGYGGGGGGYGGSRRDDDRDRDRDYFARGDDRGGRGGDYRGGRGGERQRWGGGGGGAGAGGRRRY